MKRKIVAVFAALAVMCSMFSFNVYAETEESQESAESDTDTSENSANPLNLTAKAAVLMNAETGQIVYALNSQQQLPEASITKIMTMLLVFEAYDAGRLKMDELVTCSEYAASMGGSQIWLEPGEQMTVDDLIKAALDRKSVV